MDVDKLIKKALSNNSKGASIRLQNQWKNFSPKTKIILRKKYIDSDKDKVPNKWDCQPYNKWKQEKSEVDYVKAGIKPVAHVLTSQDIQYAKSLGLFITPDKIGAFITRTKNEPYLRKVLNSQADATVEGQAFGYPKKSIEGHDTGIYAFQPKIEYELKGKDTKDLDYLEYVPFGMTYEEAQEDALRRKQATINPPPRQATHVVKWMAEQKRLHPEMSYQQLEDEWLKFSKQERKQFYDKVY